MSYYARARETTRVGDEGSDPHFMFSSHKDYNSNTTVYLNTASTSFPGGGGGGDLIMYGHRYSMKSSMDQLLKVANPARGQLNREN